VVAAVIWVVSRLRDRGRHDAEIAALEARVTRLERSDEDRGRQS
jgi:hypothetical protein